MENIDHNAFVKEQQELELDELAALEAMEAELKSPESVTPY